MKLTQRGKIVVGSLLVVGVILVIGVAFLSIFWAANLEYSEPQTPKTLCVEGTVLQADGSCMNQEVSS